MAKKRKDIPDHFDVLVAEIVRALRGKRSQAQLSRRLKYRFNQVHRWESGQTAISWRDTIKLAAATGVDVERALSKAFHCDGIASDAASIVKHVIGSRPLTEIAKDVGISRFSLSRWLSGARQPRLKEILRLVDACTLFLPEFANELVGGCPLASLATVFELRKRESALQERHPWAAALIREIEAGLHVPLKSRGGTKLSSKLGIPSTEISAVVSELQSLGLVRHVGGKWEVSNRKLHLEPAAMQAVGRFWFRVFVDAFETFKGDQESFGGHNVFTTSPEALARIKERYLQFYNEATAILTSDTAKPSVVAVQLYAQFKIDQLR